MRLAVNGLSVRFDSIEALSGVDLDVDATEPVGLIGPNGAGKTTLLNAIGGLVRREAGSVTLEGRPLTGLAPDQIARAGVARTFQSPRLFARMTVAENVRAGRPVSARPWLHVVGLEARDGELASALTPADARRVELARALAGDPKLLLLDEPCGGLTAAEIEFMVALIERAAAPGRIMIVIEHKLAVIRRLCHRVAVLQLGQKIFDGPVERLRADPRVLEAYLGRSRL